MIISLKFHGDPTPLAAISRLMENFVESRPWPEPDIVLPVPLHVTRLRERGFNQSILLARACFPRWRARIACEVLARQRATVPQVGLSGAERRYNLKGAFRVPRPEMVADKGILLVDDVFTTGGTVMECAAALRTAGAREVDVFTVTRVSS